MPTTPLLAAAMARLVADDLAARSASEDLQDAALRLADAGFPAMKPRDLAELGDLFRTCVQGSAGGDRALVERYLAHVREGAPLAVADAERGRRLLASAVAQLQAGPRLRMQELFGQAVEAGLRARAETARRVQEAALHPAAPPPVTAGTPSPPVSGSMTLVGQDPSLEPRSAAARPTSDPDSAKRSRADGMRDQLVGIDAAIAVAELELRRAEEHWTFVHTRTSEEYPLSEARTRLANAKRDAASARKRREAIEDAARREGIPPGWLR